MYKILLFLCLPLGACAYFGEGKMIREYCLDKANCEGGNEADVFECEARIGYYKEIADAYECQKELEDLEECQISESSCEEFGDEDYYTTIDEDDGDDECDDEVEEWAECLDKGSRSVYDDYDD